MFRKLNLSNFRSIKNAEMSLEKLTVFVGANGCGKSNIIRSFEFISSIATSGLDNAILSFGGFNNILPKHLSFQLIQDARVKFEYTYELDSPPGFEEQFQPIEVQHSFSMAQQSFPRNVHVEEEQLCFTKPLPVVLALDDEKFAKFGISPEDLMNSKIWIHRSRNKPDSIETFPEINDQTSKLFVKWFGLEFLPDENNS